MEEPVTELNELIAANLRNVIEKIEGALKSGEKLADEFLLKGELSNKQAQLAEAHQQQEHFEKDKKEEKIRDASIAYLVDREAKLNAQEKEQYAQFLEKDYFTKADVKNLDEFYAKTWDKLSDDGKAEISQRLWEGVRRGELEFSDLAAETRRKEADFLYQRMTGQIQTNPPLWNIPEQDREDFKQAYEAKDQKAVDEVLARPSASQKVPSEKSASLLEADFSKEIKPEEKNREEEKKDKSATSQTLAFDSESGVNPFNLPANGGSSGRSPI